jgi:hypothetical protein
MGEERGVAGFRQRQKNLFVGDDSDHHASSLFLVRFSGLDLFFLFNILISWFLGVIKVFVGCFVVEMIWKKNVSG